ncbi:polar amino acid transport system ATP-binding protein [Rhodoligotrophos appendicifer]|uniref:ectoine/hydroxyectoine ABC transporter ATP-binding protein EhuA n=1 Tax=Rhodoligotrophos appendicifer TaxID=987056 RepID=UPI00117E2F22|nr:ectoine/hydroxyectoine ABC transporter ATP-binding protein EhuA [Rhodoligotrophos appendicifer]
MSLLVKCRGLSKRYGAHVVLDKLNFDLADNEKVAIIGRSGSGKSTLLRVLMTLEDVDEGLVEIEGVNLWEPSSKGGVKRAEAATVRAIRSRIGMVFQQFNLFPHKTALENVALAPHLVGKLSRDASRVRATELLASVGLADKLKAYPAQLSGGQQQRVAIARALAMRPKIMLFDEVTSALDPEVVGEVLEVIRKLAAEHSVAMILVTHQMGFAKEIADRVCFFDDGRILEEGPPESVLGNPKNERTQVFLKAVLEA